MSFMDQSSAAGLSLSVLFWKVWHTDKDQMCVGFSKFWDSPGPSLNMLLVAGNWYPQHRFSLAVDARQS